MRQMKKGGALETVLLFGCWLSCHSLEQQSAELTDRESLRTMQGNKLIDYTSPKEAVSIFFFQCFFPITIIIYTCYRKLKNRKQSPSHKVPLPCPLFLSYHCYLLIMNPSRKCLVIYIHLYPLFYINGIVLCSLLLNNISTYISLVSLKIIFIVFVKMIHIHSKSFK